jgi:fatty acid desaturase
MRSGVRFGPVSRSAGRNRRRKRGKYTMKSTVALALLVAVIYLLVSGGWWVVLGLTILGVALIGLLVRGVKHTPGAQHQGGHGSDVPAKPASNRRHHSDRR